MHRDWKVNKIFVISSVEAAGYSKRQTRYSSNNREFGDHGHVVLTSRMVTYGPNHGMPHTRATGEGLFEIRAKAEEGFGRAFYCTLVGRRIVILHGFIKKTEKTPQRELVYRLVVRPA